jgi:hypothetical protein
MGGLFSGGGPLYKAEVESKQMQTLMHKQQAEAAKLALDEAKLKYSKLKMEEDFLNSPEVQGIIQGGQMRMDLSPEEGTPGFNPPADLPTLMTLLATAKARAGDSSGLAQLAQASQQLTQKEFINKWLLNKPNIQPGGQTQSQGVGEGPVMGLAPEQVAALKASGLDLTDVIRLFTPDYDKVQTFDEKTGAYYWTFKDKKTGKFQMTKNNEPLMVPAKPAEFNRVPITNQENAPGMMLERKDQPGKFLSPWQQTGPAPLEATTRVTPQGGEEKIWVNPYQKGGISGPGGIPTKLPPTEIPTPTDPESKKEVTDLVTTAKELRAMAEETDPRFVGVWSQIGQIINKKGAGLGLMKTDPKFTKWQGTVENYKTMTRRSLFGTQITKGEEKSFNKFWPDEWWNDVDGFKKGLVTVARAMELKADARARGQMLSGTKLLEMAEKEIGSKPKLGIGGPPKTAEEFMERLNKRGRK